MNILTKEIVEDFEQWYKENYMDAEDGFVELTLEELTIRVALYVLDKSESD